MEKLFCTRLGVVSSAFVATTVLLVSSAQAQAQAGSFTVVVTIANGGLTLAPSTVPAGSVVFRIVNKGRVARDFEIASKRAPTIAIGKSATLRVVVAKRSYRYFSVGQGGAARLSGLLGVLEPCPNPTASTVSVQLITGSITLSQSAVPCGTVTFVVTNKDAYFIHDFNLWVPTEVTGQALGPRLHPGATASTTVRFPYRGNVYYFCREPQHDEHQGESGNLTVD